MRSGSAEGYPQVNRRHFILGTGSLFVPIPEPVRVYSFVGGWAQHWMDDVQAGDPFAIDRGVRGTNVIVRHHGSGMRFQMWRETPTGLAIDPQLTESAMGAMLGKENNMENVREFTRVIRRFA